MEAVVPAHRPPRSLGDKAAWKIVRLARYCMDKATGMDREQRGDRSKPTTAIEADKPLTEAQWVRDRLLFPRLNIADMKIRQFIVDPLRLS